MSQPPLLPGRVEPKTITSSSSLRAGLSSLSGELSAERVWG
jgi:hypothetical protein